MFRFSIVVTQTILCHIFTGFHFPVPFRKPTDRFQKIAQYVLFICLRLTWVLSSGGNFAYLRAFQMKAWSLPELAPATRPWKSPLFLELVAPLCLLRITAADPFLIPTENFALLATVSGQLTRLIWEITEQEANQQMSRIGYHAGLKTSSLSRYHHTASFPRHYCNCRDVCFCPLLPWTVLLFL